MANPALADSRQNYCNPVDDEGYNLQLFKAIMNQINLIKFGMDSQISSNY